MPVHESGAIKQPGNIPATSGGITHIIDSDQLGNSLQVMQMFMYPVRAIGSVYMCGSTQ